MRAVVSIKKKVASYKLLEKIFSAEQVSGKLLFSVLISDMIINQVMLNNSPSDQNPIDGWTVARSAGRRILF